MRTMIFITLLSFLSVQLMAGDGNTTAYIENHGALNLTVEGLPSDNGSLKILLFNNETGFPLQEWNAVYAIELDIAAEGNSMVFKSIPFGEYAIYVYHDENSNGKFDKSWTGTPKEAFAYSNRKNAKRTIPLYSQSVFTFDKDGMQLTLEVVTAKSDGKPISKK